MAAKAKPRAAKGAEVPPAPRLWRDRQRSDVSGEIRRQTRKLFSQMWSRRQTATRHAQELTTFGLAGPGGFVILDAVGAHRKRKARNGPKTFFDLAPKERARELAGLAKLLKSEITSKILTKWAAATGAANEWRQFFMHDAVWGTIQWRKSLGRPAGQPMANGFVIKSEYLGISGNDLGGGIVQDTSRWYPVAVNAWDAPDLGQFHRVMYSTITPAIFPCHLSVTFSGVAWKGGSPAGTYLRIFGAPLSYLKRDHNLVVLPTITVDSALLESLSH